MSDASDAQFFLVAEEHNDRDIPRFVTAVFRTLHEAYGFNYAAFEEDPMGMERMGAEPLRGDLGRIGAFAHDHPAQITFATDEELRAIAAIGTISTGGWSPIWGADQAFGATVYLEELKALAPDPQAAALVDALLSDASGSERPHTDDRPHFMSSRAIELVDRFRALRTAFAPRPGTRSDRLTSDLITSAEVYSYYLRNEAGDHDVVLQNNTEREDVIRRRFMDNYRHAFAADGVMPKVVLKYGQWHIRRGISPGNAFNLGTFVNDLALSNNMSALTVNVVVYGDGSPDSYPTFELGSGTMRTLLGTAPTGWTLLDLRALRGRWYADPASFGFNAVQNAAFQASVFGYDYILFIPDARRSTNTTVGPR